MNRRGFLKQVAGAVVTAMVPIPKAEAPGLQTGGTWHNEALKKVNQDHAIDALRYSCGYAFLTAKLERDPLLLPIQPLRRETWLINFEGV